MGENCAVQSAERTEIGSGDRILISGLSWFGDTPSVRMRVNDAASTLVPLRGLQLRYRVTASARHQCIGHKPFRDRSVDWVDCDRPTLHDGRTCDRCAANDATFASQLHHAHTRGSGELDAAVRTHLEQPNSLYLAAFRDGSIKVGTSTAPRLQTRLCEQGAWAARIVASTTDGFAVRTLEDRVTVELGLAQSVSVRRKLDGLVRPVPAERIDTELDRWSSAVHSLIERHSDERVEAISVTWNSPVSNDPNFEGVHAYPLKLQSGGHDVELSMASGRIVVLRRPGSNDRFVADLRSLFGLEITIDDVEPDELTVQDSLF